MKSGKDEAEIVSLYLRRDPWSKKPTCSTWTDCPRLNVFRITPHKITEWPLMRNFTISFNDPNLQKWEAETKLRCQNLG